MKALFSALRYWQSPAPPSEGISTNGKHSTCILNSPPLPYVRRAVFYNDITGMHPGKL